MREGRGVRSPAFLLFGILCDCDSCNRVNCSCIRWNFLTSIAKVAGVLKSFAAERTELSVTDAAALLGVASPMFAVEGLVLNG